MFTPAAGTYTTTQNVTITAKSGNTIYYTTDGSEPTAEVGLIYNDGMPISVDRDMTIKAIAFDKQSNEQSDIATAEYIIKRVFCFSTDNATATLGKEFIAPELTNTYPDGTVTWESSDNNVASVDNNGKATPLSQGTTIITAQLLRPDSPTLTATYTLTVSDPTILPLANAYYKLVTSNADIVDGGVYLIVCKTNDTNGANGMAMGEIINKYGIGIDVNIEQERINIPTDAEIIITKHKDNTWLIKNNTGYIGYKNNTDFEISSTSNTTNAFQWIIDVTTPDSVTIKNYKSVNRYIRAKITDKKFRVYSDLSGTSKISLYRKMGALKITSGGRDSDGRYYATYFTDVAISVPEDVTFTTVGIVDDQMILTDFSTNSVIPASTGLVVSAEEPGIYEYAVSGKAATLSGNHTGNLLKGDIKDITADDMTATDTDHTFFRLAKPSGESLGFWWGAPDGNGFSLGAYKAYLAVPNSVSAAKGFSFGSAVSSITTIRNTEKPRPDVIYNLHGQRVSNAVRSGIYIKDGKKFIKR
ncbi:MAG: chitobiase/beta-hexosaminidase C-terminal domain-containing protein [Prevotella sp.]|nr:chitobiase/beta-hexosaminidase C-terminal domain-containing protein [Prevotella sp.]